MPLIRDKKGATSGRPPGMKPWTWWWKIKETIANTVPKLWLA